MQNITNYNAYLGDRLGDIIFFGIGGGVINFRKYLANIFVTTPPPISWSIFFMTPYFKKIIGPLLQDTFKPIL